MSVEALSKMWRIRMPSAQKLAAMKICDCVNDFGECRFQSVAQFAAGCGLSERQVLSSVRALVRDGLLSEADGERGYELAFVVNMPRLRALADRFAGGGPTA